MSSRFPPNDPRSGGEYPARDPGQTGGWRQPGPWQRGRGDDDRAGSQHQTSASQPYHIPRYVPGGAPPPPANPRSVRGRVPDRQPPAKRSAHTSMSGSRTDPTLYEWDRLSPEQQQAVLTTVGARGASSTPSTRAILIGVLVVLVVLGVIVVALALFHGL